MSAELKMVRALREEVEALNRALGLSMTLIEQLEKFAIPAERPKDGPRPDGRGGVA